MKAFQITLTSVVTNLVQQGSRSAARWRRRLASSLELMRSLDEARALLFKRLEPCDWDIYFSPRELMGGKYTLAEYIIFFKYDRHGDAERILDEIAEMGVNAVAPRTRLFDAAAEGYELSLQYGIHIWGNMKNGLLQASNELAWVLQQIGRYDEAEEAMNMYRSENEFSYA